MDGGVYYTYNFVEHGNEAGGVSYPWGGQKLQSELNISLQWVTKASAKSYRVMKDGRPNPFEFDQIEGTRTFIKETLLQTDGIVDLTRSAGQYPGSWTLPVCNASWWGRSWNWNYADKPEIRESTGTHPPCLSGKSSTSSSSSSSSSSSTFSRSEVE